TGDHEQEPTRFELERNGRLLRGLIHRRGAHSTFWTCSPRSSVSSLMMIPARVMSTSFDLEAIVFASRFISWSRKFSLRPASSDPSMSERNWSVCADRRTHYSRQS